MPVPRTADRRAILLQHRGEHLQPRADRKLQQLRARIHEQIDERQMTLARVNRVGGTDRLCETLVSWRLLVWRAFARASHHSFYTSSEEPPLSNFNSYWDISATFNAVTPEAQGQRKKLHTSTLELAELAKKARPGLLIIYHRSNLGGLGRGLANPFDVLLQEIQRTVQWPGCDWPGPRNLLELGCGHAPATPSNKNEADRVCTRC